MWGNLRQNLSRNANRSPADIFRACCLITSPQEPFQYSLTGGSEHTVGSGDFARKFCFY